MLGPIKFFVIQELAFTLIELMVVISIIAILAMVGLVTYGSAQKGARMAKVSLDFESMQKAIDIARQAAGGKALIQITNNSDSMWHCDPEHDGLPANTKPVEIPQCMSDLKTSWSKVTTEPLPFDPWGNPYMFDENEGESWFGSTCAEDIIYSAGPDGLLWNGPGDNDELGYSVTLGVLTGTPWTSQCAGQNTLFIDS